MSRESTTNERGAKPEPTAPHPGRARRVAKHTPRPASWPRTLRLALRLAESRDDFAPSHAAVHQKLLLDAPSRVIEVELRALLAVWPTLPTRWLDVLARSPLWMMLARRCPAALSPGFAGELARILEADDGAAPSERFARAAATARALELGDLVDAVSPETMALLVAAAPSEDDLLDELDEVLARWLDVRGEEAPALRTQLLALPGGDALAVIAVRFEPTSLRILEVARRAATSLREGCPEHTIAYPTCRPGLPEPRRPFRGIARELARHEATRAITRASRERREIAADGLVVAYVLAEEPLVQGIVETWLWMHREQVDWHELLAGLDGSGFLARFAAASCALGPADRAHEDDASSRSPRQGS